MYSNLRVKQPARVGAEPIALSGDSQAISRGIHRRIRSENAGFDALDRWELWTLGPGDRSMPLTFSREVRFRLSVSPGACHFNGTLDAASQKRKTCPQEHVFLLPHFCFDHYCFDYLPALAVVFAAPLLLLTSTAGVLRLLRRLIVLFAT